MGNRITKPLVIVTAFYFERMHRFLESLERYEAGIPYDMIFVHNCIPDTEQRKPDMPLRHEELARMLKATSHRYIPRVNTGEDVGAQWHGLNNRPKDYDMYFFVNEITKIQKDGWLKAHADAYEDPIIGATCPQICRGIKFPWCLRTTFWSIRGDLIDALKWPEPKTREEAARQEMELIWPYIQSLGLKCKQVGNGTEWMNYYYDDGRPYTNFTHSTEVEL